MNYPTLGAGKEYKLLVQIYSMSLMYCTIKTAAFLKVQSKGLPYFDNPVGLLLSDLVDFQSLGYKSWRSSHH